MLTEVADGVFVRQSAFCLSNAVIVRGGRSALLVDPGVTGEDMAELADDVEGIGLGVALGFATHPHWDHVLWHHRFGAPPRLGTPVCAAASRARREHLRRQAASVAPDVDPQMIGLIDALPDGCDSLPWAGPEAGVVEHRAHAPGHAALLVRSANVLVAGDMLSDVEVPLLDEEGEDPLGDYARGLEQLALLIAAGVTTVIPGHGAVASGSEVAARLEADRAYVGALRSGSEPQDARVGPGAGYGADWLPAAHERNVDLARSAACG